MDGSGLRDRPPTMSGSLLPEPYSHAEHAAARQSAPKGRGRRGTTAAPGSRLGPGCHRVLRSCRQSLTGSKGSPAGQRETVWRMHGEIQQLARYPQARLDLAAVCKVVGNVVAV
jgi:hypothetical protein